MKKRKNNNGVFYVVISLVAVLAVGGIALAFTGSANRVIENVQVYNEATQPSVEVDNGMLGAFPGGDMYQRVNAHAGVQSGGDVYATSTIDATITLAAKHVKDDITFVNWTPGATTTITIMATTSADISSINIPNAGDERSYFWYNASAVVEDETITIAAGTGIDLQMNEDTADLAIDPLTMTKLTFIRKVDTDVMVILDQYDLAD